jgi:ABC-2 type transport system permease protein
MKNVAEIYKREIRFYFTTPIAYVVIIIFTLIFGFLFYRSLVYYSQLSYQLMQNPAYGQRLDLVVGVFSPVFANNAIIFLMLIPPISMRLIAEEKKSGTIELLFTYHIKDIHIVMGKWLAASTIIFLMLLLTVPAPLMAFKFAGTAEWGPILSGYMGMFLMGLSFLSLGVLISALSENQIVSIIISYGVLLAFWFLGWVVDPNSGRPIGKVLGEMSIIDHLSNSVKGVIDTRDILYFVLFIFVSLFLTHRVLESKRWRG